MSPSFYTTIIPNEKIIVSVYNNLCILFQQSHLIPSIVETVKGYANHEKNTLEEVVALRNNYNDSMSTNEKVKTNNKISERVTRLMALAESYPELKASENFNNLSKQLTKIEDDIANSRKYYNGTVRIFNNKVQMFPSNIIAKIFKYQEKSMFVATNEDRQNIKIEL